MDDSHIISLANIVQKQVYYHVNTIDTILYRYIEICMWARSIQHISDFDLKIDPKTDISDEWVIATLFSWPTSFTSKCTIRSIP